MSKLNELIAEFCPNGVEYKILGELGEFFGGLTGKIKDDFSNGNCKFISYMNVFSNLSINTRTNDLVRIQDGENQRVVKNGDVIFTGSSETLNECGMSSVFINDSDEPFYLNSFCFAFRLYNSNLLLPHFSKYLFRADEIRKQIVKTASGVTRFNVSKKKMEKVIIPIPPIPVQEEIVSILDKFTELTAKLTSELTSELTSRKQQYEYYRNKLLNFGDEIELRTLGDIADIGVGSKPTKIYETQKEYEYINAGTTNSGYIDKYNCEGDTVTTPSRGQGGIGFVGYQKDRFWLGPLCYRIQAKKSMSMMSKYLYYFLQGNNNLILKLKKEGGVPAVNRVDLIKLPIPIPPLEEQQRIIAILDRFDTLGNNITQNLSAEIKTRQRQYKYYRDKLLTFRRVKNE